MAEKPLIQQHFLKWTGKYGFLAKTIFFFENTSKKNINWNSNMLQAQQLLLSKKSALIKFNFRPRRTSKLKVDFRGLKGDSR